MILSSIVSVSVNDAVQVYAAKSNIFIKDVVPSSIKIPNSAVFQASSPNGKVRQYNASAVYLVNGLFDVVCNLPSGSLFPFGDTKVTCKSADKPGNIAIKSFKINVQDRTPPVMEACSFIFDISDMRDMGYSFFFKIRTVLALKDHAGCPSPAPVANAGKDFEISEGKNGHLDGSKSMSIQGGKLSYTWKQIGGASSKLSNSHSPTPKFTAPKVDKDTKLKFELTVTDNRAMSSSDLVSVSVKNLITKSFDGTGINIGITDDGPGINIATVGDWGCNANTQQTMDNINNINPELLLALGDYSYTNTATCWLDIIKPLDSNTRIAIGNHEDESSEANKQYLNHFGLSKSYYSFEYDNIHVLVINSEQDIDSGSSQYDFVKNDLQLASKNPSILWKIVIFHHPPYTSPTACSACEPLNSLRDAVHPLFDKYAVDLVLLGHVHNYQRSFPLKYNQNNPSEPIITSSNEHNYLDPVGQIYAIVGTGGINFHALSGKESYIDYQQDSKFGFLSIHFSEDGKNMNSKFISNDGSIIDQFSIKKSQIQKNQKIEDNILPKANDQKTSVDKDGQLDITLVGKDDDKDPIRFEIVSSPSNGRLDDFDETKGTVTYVPKKGYAGNDEFKFRVTDNKGAASNIAIVTVNVKEGNKAPKALDQSVSVTHNGQIDITLVADDDDKDALQFDITAYPMHGTLDRFDKEEGTVSYAPNKGYLGDDKFSFRAIDNKGAKSNEVNVDISVKELSQRVGNQEAVSSNSVEKSINETGVEQTTKTNSVEEPNKTLSADAGADQKVQVNDEVKLDGSKSSDEDGKLVSYKWEQTDGPKVDLKNFQKQVANFDVPSSANNSRLVFKLKVVDDKGVSSSDDVSVEVEKVEKNIPPKANEISPTFKATLVQNDTNLFHDLILSSFTTDNDRLNTLSADYPKKATFRLQQNLPINIISKNFDSKIFVKDIILYDDENNPYHLKTDSDDNWIPNVPVGIYRMQVKGKYSPDGNNAISFIDRVEILKILK